MKETIEEADAEQIIEWIEDGEATISSNGLRLILPNGWQVDMDGTVVVRHYSRTYDDIGPHGPAIYSAAQGVTV